MANSQQRIAAVVIASSTVALGGQADCGKYGCFWEGIQALERAEQVSERAESPGPGANVTVEAPRLEIGFRVNG